MYMCIYIILYIYIYTYMYISRRREYHLSIEYTSPGEYWTLCTVWPVQLFNRCRKHTTCTHKVYVCTTYMYIYIYMSIYMHLYINVNTHMNMSCIRLRGVYIYVYIYTWHVCVFLSHSNHFTMSDCNPYCLHSTHYTHMYMYIYIPPGQNWICHALHVMCVQHMHAHLTSHVIC